MIKISVKLLLIIVTINLLFFGCVSKNQKTIRKDLFFKENQFVNFTNWKGWRISYGNGEYVTEYESDSTDEVKRFLFFHKNNQNFIILAITGKISYGINIDTLSNDILWRKLYKEINIKDLKSHINFVVKYNILLAYYHDNPKRIIFKSLNKDLNLIYSFNPNDSILLRKKHKRININWYEY